MRSRFAIRRLGALAACAGCALLAAGCNPLADEAPVADEDVEVISVTGAERGISDLSYVATDRRISVYDIDRDFRLVRTIEIPDRFDPVNVRGMQADPRSDRLFISYWGAEPDDGSGHLLAYDLDSNKVAWDRDLEPSVDSFALTPDGSKIYMPCSEHADCDWWFVLDARTGDEIGRITVTDGTHNTIVGPSGSRAYLASLKSPLLRVADTSTDRIVDEIGPFSDSIRPFTVNASETLVFVNVDFLSGFEVADLRTGKRLYTVKVKGFPLAREDFPELPVTQSHGITLSPDEREAWVVDDHYDYLHVFDVKGLPDAAPRQIADVRLSGSPKWVNFTRDGRFVHVSTGEIVDARTRKVIALVEPSRVYIEVVERGGEPIRAYSRYGLGYGRSSRAGNP